MARVPLRVQTALLRGLTRLPRGLRAAAPPPFSTPRNPRHPQKERLNSLEGPRSTAIPRRQGDTRGPSRRGELGVDLGGVAGSGPGTKVTKDDVLAAADGAATGRCRCARCRHGRRGEGPAGAGGDARQGDGREPRGADRDLLPDDRGRHPRRQAQGAQQGPQRARDEGLLHPPRRLGDRPGREGLPGDGPLLRGARRQAGRDRGQPGQPRHRRRRRAQGRLAQPDGARDQGRRRPRLRRLPLLLRGADQQDPREQADRGRLPGHEHLADQPRRDRHRRLGAAADEGPERDHRHRLDRLPAGVGARQPRPAASARRLEGDDADLDLRPPGDPGRRVGRLPAPHRAAPPGRRRLLRGDRRRPRRRGGADRRRPPRLGLGAAARRRRPGDRRRPSPTRSCCRASRRRPRCSRPTAPTATWRRGSTRSAASRRATRRSSRRTST